VDKTGSSSTFGAALALSHIRSGIIDISYYVLFLRGRYYLGNQEILGRFLVKFLLEKEIRADSFPGFSSFCPCSPSGVDRVSSPLSNSSSPFASISLFTLG
jgi:hypothetical protein